MADDDFDDLDPATIPEKPSGSGSPIDPRQLEFMKQQYELDMRAHDVRRHLARNFTLILGGYIVFEIGTSVYILFKANVPANIDVKDALDMFQNTYSQTLTAIVGLVAGVIGFYFGSNSGSK